MTNPSDALRVVVGHEEIMAILDRYGFVCGDPHSDCNRARAAIAQALENDARYRFLRKNHLREWESDMPHNKGAPSLDIDFSADGHDLDAAIDSAIAAQQKEEGK